MHRKFHKRNQVEMQRLKQSMPQVLIISGLSRFARASALNWLVAAGRHSDPDSFMVVESEKPSISIESVRLINARLHRKREVQSPIVVHIKEAHLLTQPAQNALLKILEETPENAHIFLTVSNKDLLLPTIRSRAYGLELLPLDKKSFEEATNIPPADAGRLAKLSGGDPWVVTAEDTKHVNGDMLKVVTEILKAPLGDALIKSQKLIKEQDVFEQLLSVLAKIAQAGIRASARTNNTEAGRWQKRLELTVDLQDIFQLTGINQKLLMDKLILEFRSV